MLKKYKKLMQMNKLTQRFISNKKELFDLHILNKDQTKLIYANKNSFCPINNPNSESTKFYKENEEQFNWYLSGLFCSHSSFWEINTDTKYAKIKLSLNVKEVTTLFWLWEMFPLFQIPKPVKNSNCWCIRSSKYELIKDIYIKLNGKVFLPKNIIYMQTLSQIFNIPFVECDPSKIDFTKNAFLSGLFDAEGDWSYNFNKTVKKQYIIWSVCQQDRNILRIVQNSFNTKFMKLGSIVDHFSKDYELHNRFYTFTRWTIFSNTFENYTFLIQYFEKFPLKTYKALGINRLKLLLEHYKYRTYKSKDVKVVEHFLDFMQNFNKPLGENEKEFYFLEKYKVPSNIISESKKD